MTFLQSQERNEACQLISRSVFEWKCLCECNFVYDDGEFFMILNVSFDNMSFELYLQGDVKTEPE